MPVSSSSSVWSFSANSANDSCAITCKILTFLSSILTSSFPSCFTQSRKPRPIFCLWVNWVLFSISVQIWNTLGLSQPSFNAEWEKINLNGHSNDNNHSLSFIIVLYVSVSSAVSPLVSFNLPFLSCEISIVDFFNRVVEEFF